MQKRLKRLETTVAARVDGPWSWEKKVAEVEACAMQRLPPEDQVLLTEVFARPTSCEMYKLMEANPALWARYEEAFEWACREVPAPFVMTVHDGWV
jgi:hypothetical protein